MTREQLASILHHRPAIHHLCTGIFLQAPLRLSEGVFAVPARPMGVRHLAEYLAGYAEEISATDKPDLNAAEERDSRELPVTSVVLHAASPTSIGTDVRQSAAN